MPSDKKTRPVVAGRGSFALVLVAAAIFAAGAIDAAQAQLFPWGGWQGPSWQPAPRRRQRAPHYVEPKEADPTSTLPKPEGPLVLVVSIGEQKVTVYDGEKQIATAPISSGMRGHPTPTGIFSILEKNRYHYSNLYGGAPMPFMQRLTNSGVAMHAGDLPGYPASHGCIRLPYSFARKLFAITEIGARVIVSHGNPGPAEFRSAHLIGPLPPETQAGNEAPQRLAAAEPASTSRREISTMMSTAQGDRKGRTREMAAAERAAERDRLAAAITAAESAKAAAIEQAKAAAEAARAAKDDVRKARNEKERLADAARKAAREADRAEERFADLTRKMGKIDVEKLDAAELQKQSEEELAEEAKVLDLAAAAVAAKGLVAKQTEAIAKAESDAEAADKARRAAADGVPKAEQALADAKAALAAAEAFEARKDMPVSIFISAKTGSLKAKLGFAEVLEAPITITDPGRPLGTHVLTATAFTDGEKALRWTAVTFKVNENQAPPRRKRRRHEDEVYVVPAGDDADPASALQRIQIPQETAERLAELMKPGSSFIVSDYGLSRETSHRTEFVVEPWRARRHAEDRDYRYD